MSIPAELSESTALNLYSDPSPTVRSAIMQPCPVLLAGGSDTRLWAIFRKPRLKQLVDALGPRSPLQATVQRLDGLSTHPVDVAPARHGPCDARRRKRFLQSENESTFIPLGVQHRLDNPGRYPSKS